MDREQDRPESHDKNPIQPLERIALTANVAAQLMSSGRSTFFDRVKRGIYPRARADGLWRVADLVGPPPNDAEWLTPDEVQELTGYQQGTAQLRQLNEYGIRGFRRPDGRVIVSRHAVRQRGLIGSPPEPKGPGPKWTKPV